MLELERKLRLAAQKKLSIPRLRDKIEDMPRNARTR